MKLIYLVFLLLTVIGLDVNATSKLTPPKVEFKIGAKQSIDNQVSNGFYVFRLNCALDFCDLTLTSYECEPIGSSERGFTPKTSTWSSRAGFLEINSKSKGKLEITIFQGTHRQLPAKVTIDYIEGERPYDTSTKVTGFKAEGLIDIKRFPNEIKTVGYEPIVGATHVEYLGCGLIVPGIEK